MNFQTTSLTLACIALLGCFGVGAGAQTLDGKATSSGKVMSINELRACIKQQEDLKTSRAEVERKRAALDAERVEISREGDALKPLKDQVQARTEAATAFNEKMKALAERVKAFQEKQAALGENSNKSGPIVDRQRKDLEREHRELQALEISTKAEAKAIGDGLEQAVKELNQRGEAHQHLAVSWNQRNKAWETESNAHEDKRVDWASNCGGRRYREDDEKAIRAEMK